MSPSALLCLSSYVPVGLPTAGQQGSSSLDCQQPTGPCPSALGCTHEDVENHPRQGPRNGSVPHRPGMLAGGLLGGHADS